MQTARPVEKWCERTVSITLRAHRPQFLKDQIFFCNTVHKHNTTKAGKGGFVQAHPRTNSQKKTVLYRASKIFNELPLDIHPSMSGVGLFDLFDLC